jgi:hypothetical protein
VKTCWKKNELIVSKRKPLSAFVDPSLTHDERLTTLFQGFTHDVPFLESDHAVNKSTLELIETLK